MRNPANSPASIIFGVLVFGFLVILLVTFLSMTDQIYILEQNKPQFVWGTAFLSFIDAFIGLQCAGALISFSLFVAAPAFMDRKAYFRSLRAIVVSMIALAAFFVVLDEGFAPLVRHDLHELQTSGTFSESLFSRATQAEKDGQLVRALEYLRLSLSVDAHNPQKIEAESELLTRIWDSDASRRDYLTVTTGEEPEEGSDLSVLLRRARDAMQAKDYERAYRYAEQVLSMDRSNAEALNIASVAGDQTFRESRAQVEERKQYLFNRTREGYQALDRGSAADILRAYGIFMRLRREFPLDENVRQYFNQAREKLPEVSFFLREAELALSIDTLVTKDIAFFNLFSEEERELVVIGRMVSVGSDTFFKDIEVTGFIRGNRILYRYTAPMGKLIQRERDGTPAFYINLNGIDRLDPARVTGPSVLVGKPPLEEGRGIRLNTTTDTSGYAPLDPRRFELYGLSKLDFSRMGIGELVSIMPPLSLHAKTRELVLLEILIRLSRPLLLLLLTAVTFSIGLT
ncbi:MAG TPA: hypothetical protein ENN69_00615, partial [Spirochaetia bacterium]|nr:hypothetical protein [Spirochaetia bacterium]